MSFPEWAMQEIERLLSSRRYAQSSEERAQCDLQLAVVCEAARRYGVSLAEYAEL